MVKREIVLVRISKLDEYIKFLDKINKYSKSEYLSDPMIYGSTERFLHLAIECVIDIANHIIADMRYRRPDSNREIVYGIVKNNLKDIEDFRNIAVEYV